MNAPCSRDIHFYGHGICYDVKINGLFWRFKCEPQPLHSILGVEGSWPISLNFLWEKNEWLKIVSHRSEGRVSVMVCYVTIFIGSCYASPIILAQCSILVESSVFIHAMHRMVLNDDILSNFFLKDFLGIFKKKIQIYINTYSIDNTFTKMNW